MVLLYYQKEMTITSFKGFNPFFFASCCQCMSLCCHYASSQNLWMLCDFKSSPLEKTQTLARPVQGPAETQTGPRRARNPKNNSHGGGKKLTIRSEEPRPAPHQATGKHGAKPKQNYHLRDPPLQLSWLGHQCPLQGKCLRSSLLSSKKKKKGPKVVILKMILICINNLDQDI